ncbi:MAG: galactose mutarotase [Bacteroidales bacterium]|nr:galactose mutarotase [Bacteroidales bacterium]
MKPIKKELWGKSACGKEIYLYTITNEKGASVQLSSVGAGIVGITVPDKDGNLADVVLGYPEAASYFADGPCAGKVPGRYANRIALGHFTLDGKEYTLPVNNGPNHLHGGPEGFQNKVWESRESEGGVEFLYYSEDGEMGYPGALKAVARYEWSEDCELRLTLTAESDAPTVVNLTNHAYFNLNGEGSGTILGHELRLNASEYLPTSDSLIPLGESEPVAGTPMDFVEAKPLGRDIKEDFPALVYGKGYDNCWVIDGAQPGQIQEAAELYAPESGRVLTVFTTQPGVQIYTGNWLAGCPEGKSGHIYSDYDGVAIECQNFPDAPNKHDYPSAVIRPGEVYQQAIIFAFGIR